MQKSFSAKKFLTERTEFSEENLNLRKLLSALLSPVRNFTLLALLLFSSCSKKPSSPTHEELAALQNQKIELAKNQAVSDFVSSLPPDEKFSELFFVNIEGNKIFHNVETVPEDFVQDSKKPLVPGGVLLFSYNISKDPLETYEFIKSIRDFYVHNNLVPPFVAVDQEGGDVNRLRGLTRSLPSQKKVAQNYSLEEAKKLYSAQARQMKNLGIHLNLAPVVEIENDSNSEFLGTRTFGNLENVLAFGKAEISSYESNKIRTALKHFPGNSSTDPHSGLPELSVTKSQLENFYLFPFKNLLPSSSAVLMSHARIKIQDDETYSEEKIPSCLSHFWVSEVVKKQMAFKGLVVSDDIFMAALAQNGFPPEKACIQALEAGIDSIMISEKRFGSSACLLYSKSREDESFAKKIDKAVENVIKFKIKCGILLLEKTNDENEIPSFKVSVNQNYPEFDLEDFDAQFTN